MMTQKFKIRYSCFGFLGCLLVYLFCDPSAVRADFDAGLNQPYHLQIVLRIADNRFLTPIFQEQVERELRDHLQLTYGKLAKVEVVRQHPLLREVRTRGLQQALDGWDELSGRKTHFLLIDFVDGRYEIQARQHDGLTGINSPVVRRERISDRRLVAQRAARLVDRDFGLAGTVIEVGKEKIKLAIRGGGLGVPLDRWLKAGDVFAVSRIRLQGDRHRAERLEWALLQATEAPHNGLCHCRYYHRYAEDRLAPPTGTLGYRCLKLTTAKAPIRLRLIDDKSLEPQAGVQVHVFQGSSAKPRELTTNQEGLAISKESYAHLALVKVIGGGGTRAQFPIEIVDERIIVCRLSSAAAGQSLDSLQARKDLWLGRLYDNLNLAAERVPELNALLAKSLDGALAGARTGLKDMDAELAALTVERDQLVRQGKEHKVALDLGDGPRLLDDLRQRHSALAEFSKRLEKAIEKSEETRRLVQSLERARLREAEADFDQAIALYKKIVETSPDQKKVLDHLEDLKKAWTTKSPEHVKAREFILQVWPRLDVAALKANLPQAEKAFALCRQNQDRLTPRKLLLANLVHAANLKKRLDVLKRQGTQDSRAEAKTIAAVAEGIRQLHAEASAFVNEKTSTKDTK